MNLDLIAINNLSLLSEHNNDTHFLQVNDKIEFEEKEKDKEYENITELNDIEYPLYFTFNHTFTLFDNIKLSKSRKHLINLMSSAIENIYDIYRDTIHDDNNKRIKEILKHIDIVIDIIFDNYRNNYCYYKCKDFYSYLVSGFCKSVIIMNEINNKLYGQPYSESDSESDSSSESDNEYNSDEDKSTDEDKNKND